MVGGEGRGTSRGTGVEVGSGVGEGGGAIGGVGERVGRRGGFGSAIAVIGTEKIISDADGGDEVGVRGGGGGRGAGRGREKGEGGGLFVIFGDEFVEPVGIGGGEKRRRRRRRRRGQRYRRQIHKLMRNHQFIKIKEEHPSITPNRTKKTISNNC